ncbi:GvpL/GvpF family gas vesicle protein [Streptomyces marincola]|uniref:GvpL/GvpF family gas vesicle protein n=1 Tax=Streptomyces marincola TaxID=2878388 RepID=UPI001CF3D8CD|nr:GvpL/GvpF family gas vesicle protein [Streptomyces marincola]UCM90524.1 GvpL/GvpF family gas vesicle protein [Streptomyces marincola]
MTGAHSVRVFAVCHAAGAAPLAGLRGHAGGGAVRRLRAGALAAVVQAVPAAEFTPEALRGHLSDRASLERFARAHHEVVAAVAAAGPAVPVPLTTLYADEDRARQAITEAAPRFLAALKRVAGRDEWGVKVFATAPAGGGAEAAGGPPPAGTGRSGRAYLDLLRERQRARETRRDTVHAEVERIDAALRACAADARRLRTHGPDLTGAQHPQVLNAAYLVDRSRSAELAATVAALRGGTERGAPLRIELTGPWAPYSFAEEDEQRPAERAGGGGGRP